MKGLAIYFYLFVSLVVGIFQGTDDVKIQINAPTEVTAGDEFQVKITLHKGNLQSFSRLVQELPAGLKATSGYSANADFTFKDNRVRLIWLKLPESDTLTITYTIKVDQRLKGTFDLVGKFSYIADNERISVEGDPVSVRINPNPNIDPSLVVDINEFKEKVVPEITPISDIPVACIRQKPSPTGESDNSYIVNLLVYKESAQKFAKIEEKIPAGYTAVNIDSKEGIFVFKNGQAKFLWMNLPQSPYFIVSYRLIPSSATAVAPEIKGQFSYVVDEKTIVKDIVERDMNVAALSAEEIRKLIEELKASPVKIPMEELLAQKPTEQKTPVAEPTVEKETKKTPTPNKKVNTQLIKEIDPAYLLEPQEGVYYRIQIAAGHRPIDIKRYFRRYKITDEVRAEIHEGWRKYSIGTFTEYKQARDYRVHIWNTTPISDAFVAAYNNGQRITVQEALMITNQKWYR
ncbi:MAG: hypothetical protein N2662_12545 [Bacteroidales bacterium]|nr:hypothetical protein [Bacteroidales bacterium]